MSDFIPNSFQFPNSIADHFMDLLTSEEWKVISYLARRTFGFNKTEDRVTLSQFSKGITTREGKRLDGGTGLSVTAVKRALDELVRFGLVLRLDENNRHTNAGVLWKLQLDSEQVNTAALNERSEKQIKNYQKRSEKRAKTLTQKSIQTAPPPLADTHLNEGEAPHLADTHPISQIPTPPISETPSLPLSQIPHNIPVQNPDQNPVYGVAEATPTQSAEPKPDLLDGMLKYARKPGEVDVSDYPEDVQPVIREICRLWSLVPPSKIGKKGSPYALWIQDARYLMNACGEIGLPVLQAVFESWGTKSPPGRPGTLITWASSAAGKLRAAKNDKNPRRWEDLSPDEQSARREAFRKAPPAVKQQEVTV
jgi:hypothetical protein